MASERVKVCPFCGGAMQVVERSFGTGVQHTEGYAQCTIGTLTFPLSSWNRRADGAPAREAVSAALGQQSAAWFAVCDVLDEIKPGWMRGPYSATDAAVRAIRALTDSPAAERTP